MELTSPYHIKYKQQTPRQTNEPFHPHSGLSHPLSLSLFDVPFLTLPFSVPTPKTSSACRCACRCCSWTSSARLSSPPHPCPPHLLHCKIMQYVGVCMNVFMFIGNDGLRHCRKGGVRWQGSVRSSLGWLLPKPPHRVHTML